MTCDFSWHSWKGWSPSVAKCPKASKHFSSAILILDRTGSGIKVLQDMWLVQKYHAFSIPNSINRSLGPSWHIQELAGLTSPGWMDKQVVLELWVGWNFLHLDLKNAPWLLKITMCLVLSIHIHPSTLKHLVFWGLLLPVLNKLYKTWVSFSYSEDPTWFWLHLAFQGFAAHLFVRP